MKTKLIIILLASLLGCDQCEPDPPLTELEKLPPATQEGKNTFGCLVNGKAWVTKTSIDARAFYQNGILSITAELKGKRQGISITVIDSALAERVYVLGDRPTSYCLLGDDLMNCSYSTDSTHGGILEISRLDQSNFIISGTFQFSAVSNTCISSMVITNGRFDLTYAP